MDDSRFDIGMRVRREVLGDEHVARAQARQTSFDADFRASSPRQHGARSGRARTSTGGRAA